MASQTASAGRRPPVRHPRSRRLPGLAAAVLAAAVLAATLGLRCTSGPDKPVVRPAAITLRLANRAPVIQAIVIDHEGRRLRRARVDAAMTLRVVAVDPDGDRLRVTWSSEPDSGAVRALGDGRAAWHPRAGTRPPRLRVRVADLQGLVAERVLVAAPDPRLVFGGRVVDPDGRPVADAVARVGGAAMRTDARGRFRLSLPDEGQAQFALELEHAAFGPLTVVALEPIADGRWVLSRATRATVALASPIAATVTSGSCALIPSSRTDWTRFARQRRAVEVRGTTAFTASPPAPLQDALAWSEGLTACPSGFSVRAGAGAFVRPNGAPASGTGQVALTQVPAWGGGSMPGDLTVRRADGSTRVMQSFGAATVRVEAEGETLQLARGQRATLRWPVDTAFVRRGRKPRPEIPLLRFDPRTAEWREDGVARLDPDGRAWSVEVGHLSTFNLDLLKDDQACVRVDATGIPDATIELEVTIPQEDMAVVRTTTLDNASAQLHALYNLPTNTLIALRAFREVAGALVPLGTFVVSTGAAQQPTDPNRPEFPYDACQGSATLLDLGATTDIVETDGDPTRAGMLVPVYVGLVDAATDDLLPAGAGSGFPVVGIFDNGSTSVFVTDVSPNRFTGPGPTDADRLGVSLGQLLTVRVAPVDMAASPATAPMGAPASGSGAADAETPGVKVRVLDTNAPDLTLLGAPFVVGHVAWIDYTIGVAIPGTSPLELGAWSRYFTAGESGVPVPQVRLPMTRFGVSSSAGAYTADQRFTVTGVTMYHGARAVGHAVPGSTALVWHDAGSTWTAISAAAATALGLTDADGIGPCYASGTLFRLDRIELVGDGGRYVVRDALVCRDDPSMVSVAGTLTTAMLGANLFRRVMVILDGPGNTLGIVRP